MAYRGRPDADTIAAMTADERRQWVEERRQWAEERRYLERIAELMDTTAYTLRGYTGIKLWEDGPNHQKVVKYVENSQCHANVKLTVVNIHRLWRKGDPKGLFEIPNRMLLWHGTKRENIPKILDTGFVLPASSGQMFGPGIYFADRITKSSNYSDSDNTFLLLCEVGLGKVYSCSSAHNDWTKPPSGYGSVKANGTYVPDWTDMGKFMGCTIPYGKTAKCTKYPSHCVNYNEFIVYDPTKIIIRFLVEVKVQRVPCPIQLVTPRSVCPLSTVPRRIPTTGPISSTAVSTVSRPKPSTVTTSSTTAALARQASISSQYRSAAIPPPYTYINGRVVHPSSSSALTPLSAVTNSAVTRSVAQASSTYYGATTTRISATSYTSASSSSSTQSSASATVVGGSVYRSVGANVLGNNPNPFLARIPISYAQTQRSLNNGDSNPNNVGCCGRCTIL